MNAIESEFIKKVCCNKKTSSVSTRRSPGRGPKILTVRLFVGTNHVSEPWGQWCVLTATPLTAPMIRNIKDQSVPEISQVQVAKSLVN